ncbi:beta-carotene isomerase D27, chloroplastic-like isoform X2 [Olea europaea var. sylvestris]|uniref:beta-carotene isomerase D27, chloroplastic-like isoform X2 n=1 Tax=Olea europaea var. sylvestris TaxID=158386 RepID=UPI000C1D4B1B|nr:beta-carotene isomerase D27, chloroplastic-like isoform X2 [Olea europaea var. sylvestris]
MVASLVHQCISPVSARVDRRDIQKLRHYPFITCVLTKPKMNTETSTLDSKKVYKDNWFDLLAINHISKNLQASTGFRSSKGGYDGFVEAATMATKLFSPTEQQKIVNQTLDMAFPRPILNMIRTLMPQSRLTREFFAVFTTIFFAWLVGPCEVKESEFEGAKEKNVVHIKKCRFLEETNCVGMCTNLCKMPSQAFIQESLGMPSTMVPSKATQRHQKNCTSS